ncbi:hypothetical protein Rhe02_76240 [Rhizocola hellebori]|uniref:Uncharacterized protein n=1 Tax=Rhizocola hellebori TaxID=1392758 RepID=A0A8J3QGA7_9ACTN|nr:hypothetical protein Rhe02_76240 [Rhizocola hellebori]
MVGSCGSAAEPPGVTTHGGGVAAREVRRPATTDRRKERLRNGAKKKWRYGAKKRE